MGDVVTLNTSTSLTLSTDLILDGAKAANLTEAIVIGTTEEGELYFAMTSGNAPDILWLLEMARATLMKEKV